MTLELNLLRCRTCGGDLSFLDKSTTAKCVYCGSLHSLVQTGSIGQKLAALLILAEQCQLEQKRAEAHAYYNRAIELDPTNAQAWIGRGLTESSFSAHSFDKAVQFAADPVAIRGRILLAIVTVGMNSSSGDPDVYAYLTTLVERGINTDDGKSAIRCLFAQLKGNSDYYTEHFRSAEQIENFARQILPDDGTITSVLDEYRFRRHVRDESRDVNQIERLSGKRRLRTRILLCAAIIGIFVGAFCGLESQPKTVILDGAVIYTPENPNGIRATLGDIRPGTLVYTADAPGGILVKSSDIHPLLYALGRALAGCLIGGLSGTIAGVLIRGPVGRKTG